MLMLIKGLKGGGYPATTVPHAEFRAFQLPLQHVALERLPELRVLDDSLQRVPAFAQVPHERPGVRDGYPQRSCILGRSHVQWDFTCPSATSMLPVGVSHSCQQPKAKK